MAGPGAERRRYFFAGAVACVAAQLLILGGIALTRYVTDAIRGRAVSIAPAPNSPAAAPNTTAALPRPVATRDVPEAVIATRVTPPSTTSTSVVSLSRPASPPSPSVRTIDWAESQAELRSALERWLIIEDRDDMRFADAEVILGADGETAKTRVPSARGGGKIVEQRWQRRPNGWIIVDHREIGGVRQ